MLVDYLRSYTRHNRATVITLAALSLVSCLLLGLIVGIAGNLVVDYRVQAEFRGESPNVTTLHAAMAFVCVLSTTSLILMLRNAFEITMGMRMRQLGIMKSIGANEAQVRRLLMAEACLFSLPAALLGIFLGLALAVGLLHVFVVANASARTLPYDPVIGITPGMLLTAAGLALATIVVSATAPARKLQRVSVIEALQGELSSGGKLPWWHRAYRLLGVEGVIAAGSLWSRRKGMRAALLSMTLATLGLVTLLNVEALSFVSTQRTYFQRYEGVWDVRLTISFDGEQAAYDQAIVQELESMPGVTQVTTGNDLERVPDPTLAYYNVLTESQVTADALSDALEQTYTGQSSVRIENRYTEIEKDARARSAIRAGIQVFAAILACIGVAGISSDVLGRTVLRRREVAKLLAAGISRAQVRRVFALESLLIVGRPLVLAAIANTCLLAWASTLGVDLLAFVRHAPIAPIAAFALGCLLAVQVVYALGERAVFSGAPLSLDLGE